MTITLKEAADTLLKGETLEWPAHGDGLKSGKAKLMSAGARRLFAYLLAKPQNLVANADESLFAGMINAWERDGDPADGIRDAAGQDRHRWLLKSVRAYNFGGLNSFGGDEFHLSVDGASWCLEGQNGSGKTSLASAILWGLTGRRIRENAGIVEDSGKREPVLAPGGAKVGDWPPLAAFPKARKDLLNDVEVRVELTFINEVGEETVARRRIVSPGLLNDAEDERDIDPRLLAFPQLLEAGILMPCRLSVLRFGEGSTDLYDAVKMLTGLDQLAAVGEGASAFRHGNKKFMKHAKDRGIDAVRAVFASSMKAAAEEAVKVGVDVSGQADLDKADTVVLRKVAEEAKVAAAAQMATLAADLGADADINTEGGRNAVTTAAVLVEQVLAAGFEGLEPVKALDAASKENAAGGLAIIPERLEDVEKDLAEALHWHVLQQKDAKLRLKAMAAPWFQPDEGHAECPLCEGELKSEAQHALAGELTQLKAVGGTAERKLADVCRDLSDKIGKSLPPSLRSFRQTLETMEPKTAVTDAVTKGFTQAGRFEDVLVGVGKVVAAKAGTAVELLPAYPVEIAEAGDEPADVAKVRSEILGLRRIIAVSSWWSENADAFRSYWDIVVGIPGEGGVAPEDSLSGKLAALNTAIKKAEPYRKLAASLETAAKKADEAAAIMKEQKVRDEIAAALEPLTLLKGLVDAETARSISALSGRIGEILERIHHKERLTYEGAALRKERSTREVDVHAGFRHAPEMKIDAGLVANTSWLRAILWGFIFALREETVEGLGYNPFPLMLLDDPQATFDPRNKQSWAMELARQTKLDQADPNRTQLLLTTHERHFFDMLGIEKAEAEFGHVLGLIPGAGPVVIENGTEIERLWRETEAENSDAKAATFITRLRGHCEAILKITLAGHLPPMESPNLTSLRKTIEELRTGRIMPFTFQPFAELVKLLDSGEPHISLLNSHTHQPAAANVAMAKRLMEFWKGGPQKKGSLEKAILRALHSYREFMAHKGDHRAYVPIAEIVPLPSAQKEEIRKAILHRNGVAAAAATDGRIPFGDGRMTITEEPGEEVRLGNHDLFRLAAGTLEPVAGVGDFLIVGNGMPARPGNLVVASVGDRVRARRLTVPESNPDVAVLVAQAVDPRAIGTPVIAPLNGFDCKKVVGVLFSVGRDVPDGGGNEVVPVEEVADYWNLIDKGRLFRVEGRSAEPLALEGQYLIAGDRVTGTAEISRLDGRLVVAVDGEGGCYFKRLRIARGGLVVLESLNPDGTCPSELMSFDRDGELPTLESAFVVRGVLFDLPR